MPTEEKKHKEHYHRISVLCAMLLVGEHIAEDVFQKVKAKESYP
jgi:hypothetical protein